MKNYLCIFLLTLLPLIASAYDAEVDGIYYNLNTSTKEATVVSGNNRYSGDIIIPPSITYNGTQYSVTSIGNAPFYACSLTSVTIPNSVTSIYRSIFYHTNIEKIYLNATVPPTLVGTTYDSNILILVPSGSETAYWNSNWQSYITVPYDEYANPISITFKDLNTKNVCVENWDKNGNGELETWEAMAVRDIGTVFQNNTNIIKFNEFKYFKNLTKISTGAFVGCTNLRAITIPDYITSIQGKGSAYRHDGAFSGCSNLTSINIPSNVTNIDWDAFEGCNNLNSVHITDLTAWCRISFGDSNSTNPLALAHHLYLNDEEVTEVVIPDGITSISPCAFDGGSSLTSISIPESVTSIGSRAFRGCSGITAVTIPASVTSIGENVFENSGLTAVDITDVGAWCGISFANDNCNPLNQLHHMRLNGDEVTSLSIPDDVTEIANYAFYGGTEFTSVNIPGSVTKIGTEAFRNCNSLTSVTLTEGLTTVGDNAFNTGGLCGVTLPSTLYGFGTTPFGSTLRFVAVTTDDPPLIGETAFPNRANAMLIVPQGSTAAYQAEMYWEDFKSIVEYPGGDVNADGDTNMVDVVDIVRFVVGTPSPVFVEVMADLDSDQAVMVDDAILLVNEIAGDVNYAKPSLAPRGSDDVLTLTGVGSRLSLLMDGSGQYAAMQFDLWLPEDVDVIEMALNDDRKQGHQLLYNKLGEGHYRVVAISTAANSFNGDSGELLGMTLDGFATNDIRLTDIHFVTPRGADIPFDDLGMSHEGEATDISDATRLNDNGQMTNDKDGWVTLDGQKLDGKPANKGVYIMNGKKYVVK